MKRILVASTALVLLALPASAQYAPDSLAEQFARINQLDAIRDQQNRFEQDIQDQQRALEHRMDELRRDQEYARRDAEAQARHLEELNVLRLPHN